MTSDPAFVCRIARSHGERAAYFALRRAIFCDEQDLYPRDGQQDRDEIDQRAYPIVCLDAATRVIGVVRLWEEEPGVWWGGRLGVDRDHRALASVGRWLIQTAVGTARAWDAHRFRATVQLANVPFFRRLHWRTVEPLTLLGRPHHLMEAELARYAPTDEIRTALPGRGLDEAA